MTEEQFAAHQKRVKAPVAQNRAERLDRIAGTRNPRKYKNEPTRVDGIRFDSKKEAKRYQELKLLETDGQISHLVVHPTYDLRVAGILICRYEADFQYLDDTEEGLVVVTEDCKGVRTPVYKLKKKLMKAIYGIEIRET